MNLFKKIGSVLLAMMLVALVFTSVASATDLCDTNPSACQCNYETCYDACYDACFAEIFGLYTWEDYARYGIEITACAGNCATCLASILAGGGDAEACLSCVQCVIENIATPVTCATKCSGACNANPCEYGYWCSPNKPCSPLLPYNYMCSGYTRKAEFCSCDAQGSYWSEVACSSGKSCCYNCVGDAVCVDLQSDIYNCGECAKECRDATVPACCSGDCKDLWKDRYNCGSCGNACGANAYCSSGTCQCNSGYGNCDGDWSNGCEVNLNTDPNNCGSCGYSCDPGVTCEKGECCEEWEDGCCKVPSGCISGYLYVAGCKDSGGSFYKGQECCDGNCHECCTDDHCQKGYICNPETHKCEEEVPEFPAGVTAVFGATLFIFLMMRRKYVRK